MSDEHQLLTDDVIEMNMRSKLSFCNELPTETITTDAGHAITVAIDGDVTSNKPAMITLHDLAQNHVTCFQPLFSFHQFRPLASLFTVYHINFPGQQENAPLLPEGYAYPTMDEMADVVAEVCRHYGLRDTVALGVGAGANVLVRVARNDPSLVECLVAFNCPVRVSTWMTWGYEKMSAHYLRKSGMTEFCSNFLIWHYFGNVNDPDTNQDCVAALRDQLEGIPHARNLAMFFEAYAQRTAIQLTRPEAGAAPTDTLKCAVLQMVGFHSPAVEDTEELNGMLDPTRSTWIKLQNTSGMLIEESPTAITNAVTLFLQGYGYALKLTAPPLPRSERCQRTFEDKEMREEVFAAPVC